MNGTLLPRFYGAWGRSAKFTLCRIRRHPLGGRDGVPMRLWATVCPYPVPLKGPVQIGGARDLDRLRNRASCQVLEHE